MQRAQPSIYPVGIGVYRSDRDGSDPGWTKDSADTGDGATGKTSQGRDITVPGDVYRERAVIGDKQSPSVVAVSPPGVTYMDQLFRTWPDGENSISSFGDSSPT